MIDREKVIKGLKCCTNQKYNTCSGCPYANLNGNGAECNKLAQDALEVLTGQEPEHPEKIETGKMKICGLASESVYKGRFEKTKCLIDAAVIDSPDMKEKQWMTFYWRDIITDEQKEITMLYANWIRFSKEITEAVARFEMEG